MTRLPLLTLLLSLPLSAQVALNGVPHQSVAGINAPNTLGVSLLNFGNSTVAQLSTLATTNSILAVGTVLIVSDAATAGDVTSGGGSIHELVQCTAITSGACSNWVALTGGGGSTPTSSIAHQWLMNDGSGTTFADAVGSTPMTTSDVTWAAATGFPGTAANFNGTSSKALTAASLSGLNGSAPFSLSIWVNTSTTGGSAQMLIGDYNDTTNYTGFGLSIGGNSNVTFQLLSVAGSNGLEVHTSSTPISVGVLHHIVATHDGSKLLSGVAIYVDGTLQSLVTDSNNLTGSIASSHPVAIGVSDVENAHWFTGVAADARIYNTVLTTGQVGALYAAGVQ